VEAVFMYQSPHNPDYIIPDLLKYQCLDESCEKQFILSEAYDNSDVKCPYCGSSNIEAIVFLEDPDKLDELGCMAISTDLEWLKKEW
jgi:DNA-directed RNA polymerase subunit RPC12/RpoP